MTRERNIAVSTLQGTGSALDIGSLAARYRRIRSHTMSLIEPLTEEDCCVQSQACCSPVKWHLGHTTWFFERFILVNALGSRPYDDRFEYLFNSYYNALGERQPRASRGHLTRPGLGEIIAYRDAVDERVVAAIEANRIGVDDLAALALGLNHEQQHQELLLTDLKHLFSCNPLAPAYCAEPRATDGDASLRWMPFEGGVRTIGTTFGNDPSVFDNECPAHRVFLEPFELADRLVTNAEFQAFIDDGGYENPEHWLDLGWSFVRSRGWTRPMYWFDRDGVPMEFTLYGTGPLVPDEPICHISFFEADAYARWAGARLPTEFELESVWEHGEACAMLDDRRYHPAPACRAGTGLRQLIGSAWEWTSSSYGPYPGFAAPHGAIGEYNGKFMCNQYVLRGGSCATPRDHIRGTYRNFFEPEARWQFSSVRLARTPSA
jgi:ergothioneine biosynthesis protein EgtB